MRVTLQLAAIALRDGTFQPKVTFVYDHSSGKDFKDYLINEICTTREQALERARRHAMEEARLQLGEGIEVEVEPEI